MLVKSWKVRPLCFQAMSISRLEAEICGRENVDWSKADYPVTYMCFDIDLAIVLTGKLHSLSLMNCIARL